MLPITLLFCCTRSCADLHAASRFWLTRHYTAMIGVGRGNMHEMLRRVCCSRIIPACAVQNLSTLTSCTYNDYLPVQPASLLGSRQFATASFEKYDPQGEMSAVTFHGPRTMKVSKKPKPSLQSPGVCMPEQNPSAQVSPAVLHLRINSSTSMRAIHKQAQQAAMYGSSFAGCDCKGLNVQYMWQ